MIKKVQYKKHLYQCHFAPLVTRVDKVNPATGEVTWSGLACELSDKVREVIIRERLFTLAGNPSTLREIVE